MTWEVVGLTRNIADISIFMSIVSRHGYEGGEDWQMAEFKLIRISG